MTNTKIRHASVADNIYNRIIKQPHLHRFIIPVEWAYETTAIESILLGKRVVRLMCECGLEWDRDKVVVADTVPHVTGFYENREPTDAAK